MRSITLYEHGVLRAAPDAGGWPEGGTPWERAVPQRWFDRLCRFDERRAEGRVFDWGYKRAKATQFVGVVQLDGVSLEILPKVERVPGDDDEASCGTVRRNLLWFLSRAGEVPCRERDLAALRTRRAPLLDALTALFASRLWEELLRGVARDYVSLEEDLRRLRGKLLVPRQVARNAVHRERFACCFDEFSEDTPLNQVLRCAAEVLVRQTRLPTAQQTLGRCLEVLDGVTALPPDRARVVAGRVLLGRQTARFTELFAFARMVLDAQSAEVIAGETSTFSLLFDMNALFEGLVTDVVSRVARRHHPQWRVHPQGKGHGRHLYDGGEAPKRLLPLAPDALLAGPDGRFVVIDAKWKRLALGARGKGPRREDLYQLHGYCTRYGADAVVLHPSGGEGTKATWHTCDEAGEALKRVTFATIDLSRDFSLRDEVTKLEDAVSKLLTEVLPPAEAAFPTEAAG